MAQLDAQCSTTPSTANLDIVMLIDISANMGASNLRQLGLSFASELSQFNIGQNTRVSLITFADIYNIVGDLNNFTNSNQLASALFGLKVSNTTSVEALPISMIKASDLLCSAAAENSNRSPVVLVLTSSLNQIYVSDMLYIVQYELSTYTRITVNYNASDTNLASVLAKVASPADNFTSNDASLYNKIQNAFLQATCKSENYYVKVKEEQEKALSDDKAIKEEKNFGSKSRQRVLPENCQKKISLRQIHNRL
uniref:VWFA domain-containing protein n=1 Tax=Acrobeloides nanus TaxID=290746 RepID=A0A914CVC0_9BILA